MGGRFAPKLLRQCVPVERPPKLSYIEQFEATSNKAAHDRPPNRPRRVGPGSIAKVAFLFTMVMAGPKAHDVLHDSLNFPLRERDFVELVTANIGAVIMPWMLAYQQSAVCNKGIGGACAVLGATSGTSILRAG